MASRQLKINSIPSTELSTRQSIRFCHPGYAPPNNTLLALPRSDCTPTGTFGVDHATALLACQIIANNSFTGYLTSDQAGQQCVDTPLDGILTESVYYFFTLGTGPVRYPIVPSFRDWEFPHDRLPSYWPRTTLLDFPSSMPQCLPQNSKHRCVVTNFSRVVEMAHLVPKEEEDWYDRNDMARYGLGFGLRDIDNPANLIPLKVDLHRVFDARGFVIVPKKASAEASYQFATHIISEREAEFWPAYHDIIIQNLLGKSYPYLFARFAWVILLSVKDFAIRDTRFVIQLTETIEEGGYKRREYKAVHLTPDRLKQAYGGGGSKSATPKGKRSRLMDENSMDSSSEDSITDEEEEMVADNKNSGRKCRRDQQSSEETAPDIEPYIPSDVKAVLQETYLRGMTEQQVSQGAREVSPEMEVDTPEKT